MATEHNPGTGSTSLKRMIIGQAMEATAIPMMLFSPDVLAGAGADAPDETPDAVSRAAADLGIDLDTLELFSFDAYRLQFALGESLAP